MKVTLSSSLLRAAPRFAAVDGTVINRTTGKPAGRRHGRALQARQQNGMELVDQAKTDAAGQVHASTRTCRGRTCSRPPSTASPTTTCCRRARRPPASRSRSTTPRSSPARRKVTKHMILSSRPAASWRSAKPSSVRTTARPPGTIPTPARSSSSCPPGAEGQGAGEAPPRRGGMPIGARRRQDRASPTSTQSISRSSRARPASTSATRCRTPPASRSRARSLTQGREHLPDRAQRRHPRGRRPERPRRRAAHQGPHLRPRRPTLTRSTLTGEQVATRRQRPRPSSAEDSGPQIEQIMPQALQTG